MGNTTGHLLGGDTRPIDLWMLLIELLILGLIAGEVGVLLFRYCKKKPILARLRNIMAAGFVLEASAPNSGADAPAWKASISVRTLQGKCTGRCI
jgi:hypothetical protein